jgi:hypothetical protein
MTILTETLLTKWTLDPTGHNTEIKLAAAEIRKAERVQRDLDLITKKYTGTLHETTAAVKEHSISQSSMASATKSASVAAKEHSTSQSSLISAFTMGALKANVYAAALNAIKSGMGDAIGATRDYANLSSAYTGSLEAARTATKGLVSDIDLMRSQNQLMTLGVQLTTDQINEMLGALVKMSATMGTDVKQAIDSATAALAKGSAERADNIGVVLSHEQAEIGYAASIGKTVSQLTDLEKKYAFQIGLLDQLTDKTDKMKSRQLTATDLVVSNWNRITGAITQASVALDKWVGKTFFTFRMSGDAAKSLKKDLEDAAKFEAGFKTSMDNLFPSATGAEMVIDLSKKKKTGRRTSRGTSSDIYDMGPDMSGELRSTADREMRMAEDARIGDMKRTANAMDDMNKESRGAIATQRGLTDAYAETLAAQRALEESMRQTPWQQYAEEMESMASGALNSLAAGMWDAAAASIASGESFSSAMSKMTASLLLGIAKQATVYGLFYTAQAIANTIFNPPEAAAKYAAAAAMFGLAGIAGGAGLGMTSASGGGGRSGGGGSRSSSSGASSPSFNSKTQKKEPTYINVYIGDPTDPAAALILQKQVTAQVKERL